jgi:hypothetical protein
MHEAKLKGTSNWLLCFSASSTTLVTFFKLNFQLGFFQRSRIANGLQEDKKKNSKKVAWDFYRLFGSFLSFSNFFET